MQKVDEAFQGVSTPDALLVELSRVLSAFGYRINRTMPQDGSEGFVTYTMATRPAGVRGAVIFVSDGGAGNVFQGWNGSAWVSLG